MNPHDILSPGTQVRINNGQRGTIVSAHVADNGIVVHTVKITHRFVSHQRGYVELTTPKTHPVNYAFIEPQP